MTTTLPAVGDVAPDFTLPATDRTPVTLSSFRGSHHVLLAFFPMAFTGVCTAELCEMSVDFDRFARTGTRVFGISVDAGPSLAAFKAAHDISVELLSDVRREVSRAYGVFNEEFCFAERAYVLIDRDGVVRWSFVEDGIGSKRDMTELLAQVEALP